jgi:diacylglycerol kinase (ATP)
MIMNKVHVIVNPFSARGKTEKKWQIIKEAIKYYYHEFKYIFTEKPKQATEIARTLLKDGFDLIIGVGGDGTLNEIANGFFHPDEPTPRTINEEASLGIIPSGTGSDFIRFLKIPRDFSKSVELIKNSKTRRIDVGKVTFHKERGKNRTRYFINVADFGLGAEVIKNLSEIPSLKRSTFHYYKGLLKTLKGYRSKHVRIVIDDTREISGKYMIGAIANGRIFGGGMIIAPEAEPDDGYFDLVLAEDMSKPEIIFNSPRLYTGSIQKHSKVSIHRARNIKVYSDDPVNIEYDGEMGQTLPAEFQCLPQPLNFRI